MFNPLAVIVAPRAFLRAFAALENLKLDARLSSVACVSLELSIAHTRALGVTDIVRGVSTPVPVARVARARPCAADRARAGHSIHNRHRRKRRATAEQRAMTRAASLAPATRACGRGRARATVGRPVRPRFARRRGRARETRSRRRNRCRRRRNRRRRATMADADAMDATRRRRPRRSSTRRSRRSGNRCARWRSWRARSRRGTRRARRNSEEASARLLGSVGRCRPSDWKRRGA